MRWLRSFFKGEHFESFVTVVLRVPGLMLVDQWSHMGVDKIVPQSQDLTDIFSASIINLMLLQGLIILILPLPKLVTLYMHYLSVAALVAASLLSRHYVLSESEETSANDFTGKLHSPVLQHTRVKLPSLSSINPQSALKFVREFRPPGLSSEVPAYQYAERALIGIGLFVDSRETENEILFYCRQFAMLAVQLFIATSVAFFLDIESNAKRALLAINSLPIVVRLSGFPQSDLLLVHNFATAVLILSVIYYGLACVPLLLTLFKNAYLEFRYQALILGYGPLITEILSKMFVPVHFLVFWGVHCAAQLHAILLHPDLVQRSGVYSDKWYMLLLCAISQICDSPLMLAGTCVAMSYFSAWILALTRIFVQGHKIFTMEQNPHAGVTEGLTMALLTVQTGLIRIKMPHRLAAMSIILFVVIASLTQSVYEATEPMLLSLSANKRSFALLQHCRILLICSVLFTLPLYMTYMLCYIFDINFWTLVVISTCIMTSVQVIGLLIIYCLFLYDATREEPWNDLDDVIYYTRAVVRCLEFFVAVFVVAAGFYESFVGQWSWTNSAVLLIHCYCNVWQRLQTGWLTFLRRRSAAKKINSLPSPSAEFLEEHDDVCAICYQSMKLGVRMTKCRHLFHGTCLRKWLYVQEKCPMCSAPITIDEPPAPKKVQFYFENPQDSVDESVASQPEEDVIEEQEIIEGTRSEGMVSSQSSPYIHEEVLLEPSLLTSVSTQNFDNLLYMAQRDVRLAKLRCRQARHTRSKSESLAEIIES